MIDLLAKPPKETIKEIYGYDLDNDPLWYHPKSGHVYRIIAIGHNEADLELMILYTKSPQGPSDPLWVRPAPNFFDGRFQVFIDD